MGTRNVRSLTVPLIVAVGAALVAVAVAFTSSGAGDGDVALDGGTPVSEESTRGVENDPRAVGSVDAPVVMVMYSDFQCQFCGRYAKNTEPGLVERFVEDGTLRIEWHDLPYLGDESLVAAKAGHAAAKQGMFWEIERQLFATQAPTNSGALTEEHLAGMAVELGMDVDQFRADMASPEVVTAIQHDVDAATQLGINGTPTFFINGKMIVGAQPAEAFINEIEKAAGAA